MNSFYAAWLILSGIAALWVGWLAWQRRAASGASQLTWLMLTLSISAFGYAFYNLALTPERRLFWMNATFSGVVAAPAVFLLWVRSITSGDRRTNWQDGVLLWVIPVLTLILARTNRYHGLFYGSAQTDIHILFREGGAWFHVFIVYALVLMGVSAFLLVRFFLRSPGSKDSQAQKQLRLYQSAFEQSPTAILITDPQGRIEYANPGLLQMTGYSLDEIKGKTHDVFRSDETSTPRQHDPWQTIKTGVTWKGEMLNRRKDGGEYWVSEQIAPLVDEAGEATHFVLMLEDITGRKQTEARLVKANQQLQIQLEENRNLQKELHEEAMRDGLTHLFNRRYMEETLAREIARAARQAAPISVVMIDVDQLKSVNDTYGHAAGDVVLQSLAKMLQENTRMSDIACRYGGDEMLVVMPGAAQAPASARADGLRKKFSEMEFSFGSEPIRITISVGIACFPEHAQNPSDLLTASDKALLWAKTNRNQVQNYNPVRMG